MTLFSRSSWCSMPWFETALVFVLSCISLLFVFSTTYQEGCPFSAYFMKQLTGYLGGWLIFGVMYCIDYRRLQRWGYFLFIGTLCLLAFTLIKGSLGGLGARRWMDFGGLKFQPSELTKLFFPAFVSYYVRDTVPAERSFKTFGPLLIIFCVSLVLILKQPDLGTTIIMLGAGLILFACAHLSKYFFIVGGLLACIGAPLLWKFLKPYQKQRVYVFLGEGTSKKERYQIEQSFIAIGSGGLLGKGLLRGTQNTLKFLPECRTDFIFSIICEEWGFIGACFVMLLYGLLFMRWIFLVSTVYNENAQLLAIGLMLPIIIATFVNIGMVMGLLPVTGNPLPLLSYGRTHTWITFASMGWLHNILSVRTL